MDFDKVNKWLTLVANLGVVVALFALIAELDHSSRQSDVAAFQSRMSERSAVNLEIATNEELVQLFEKYDNDGIDSLTPTELRRIRSWETGVILRMQGQYYQYQQGFLNRFSIDNTLDDIAPRYSRWEELGITDTIEIPEWKQEIMSRVQNR
ncbi:MAG: hypothetical protein RLP12_02695 [Ekhidna sp.]